MPAAAPALADETSSDPAQQEAPLPGADAQDPSFAEPNDPAPGGLDTQDPVESAATVEALSAYLDAAGQDSGAQALFAQDLAARGLDSGTELPGNVGTALASVGAAGTGPAAVAAPPRSWPVGTAPAGAPGLVTQLPVVHRAQVTNYYCGAAAAAQALLAIPGAERSVIDGQAISQRVLATDRYLMTDRNGKTSWAQRRLTIGMNRWLTGSDTGPYRWVDRPSPAIFLGAVHSSMNTARPMFVDAEEKHIKEWFTERFFALRGTAFADPASYFRRFTDLSDKEATLLASQIWDTINGPNLRANILPTRGRATVILRKGADHDVRWIRIRRV